MTRPPAALCVLIAATLSVVAQEQAVQTARSDTPTFDWVLFRPHADDEWTPFTGLSADEVRKLRAAAGITDEKANPIALIDTRTLGHAHILFVTAAGEQHCLDISVLVRKGKGFRKLWSAKTAPDGTNFCRPAFCAVPRAQTAKRGRIQVSVPIRLPGAPPGLCDQTSLLTYRRKGKSYELSDQQTVTAGCGLEAYRHALNAALWKAAGPETEVLVQVLPSFASRYAIAIQRTSDRLTASRITLPRQFPSWGSLLPEKLTPSQCVERAMAAPVYRTPLQLSSSEVEQYLTALTRIELRGDYCARDYYGRCANFLDGTAYFVQLRNGASAELTETQDLHVRNENPALLVWVQDLLKASRPTTQ